MVLTSGFIIELYEDKVLGVIDFRRDNAGVCAFNDGYFQRPDTKAAGACE